MTATAIHTDGFDRMAEVIESAIGGNDDYPNAAQLAAHRAKQLLQDKYFNDQYTTEQAK